MLVRSERYAGLTGGRLILVTAWQWPRSYGEPIPFDEYDPEEEARAVVEKVAAACVVPAEPVTTRVEQEAPGDTLVHCSEQADLLVVGTRGPGGLTGAIGFPSAATACTTRTAPSWPADRVVPELICAVRVGAALDPEHYARLQRWPH